jgi:hypothetical protein
MAGEIDVRQELVDHILREEDAEWEHQIMEHDPNPVEAIRAMRRAYPRPWHELDVFGEPLVRIS